jgi:hypothetical protein
VGCDVVVVIVGCVVGVAEGMVVKGFTVGWEVEGFMVEGVTVGWNVTGAWEGAIVGCFLWLMMMMFT